MRKIGAFYLLLNRSIPIKIDTDINQLLEETINRSKHCKYCNDFAQNTNNNQ